MEPGRSVCPAVFPAPAVYQRLCSVLSILDAEEVQSSKASAAIHACVAWGATSLRLFPGDPLCLPVHACLRVPFGLQRVAYACIRVAYKLQPAHPDHIVLTARLRRELPAQMPQLGRQGSPAWGRHRDFVRHRDRCDASLTSPSGRPLVFHSVRNGPLTSAYVLQRRGSAGALITWPSYARLPAPTGPVGQATAGSSQQGARSVGRELMQMPLIQLVNLRSTEAETRFTHRVEGLA